MGVKTVLAKSILQRSRLPGIGYVINPYTGCVHGCVYCYARFMKRFTDHPEPWGCFLDAKINAPEILRRQLDRRRKPLTDCVFLSSVTDPYQRPEEKFELTRRILEILLERDIPVSILTKSDLVLRDLDILERFTDGTVGMSMGIVDDGWAKALEPRASPPSARLEALRTLHDHKISTYAFVSPFLPGISDIQRIVRALSGAADEFGVEAINTEAGNWQGTVDVISRLDPSAAAACARLATDSEYWRGIELQAKALAAQAGMEMTGFFHHKNAAQLDG
jgi:DNA repair photolyase